MHRRIGHRVRAKLLQPASRFLARQAGRCGLGILSRGRCSSRCGGRRSILSGSGRGSLNGSGRGSRCGGGRSILSGSGRGSLSGSGRSILSGSGRGSLSGSGRDILSRGRRDVLIGRGWIHRVARISNSSSLLTCNHPTKPGTEPQLLPNRDRLTEPRPSDGAATVKERFFALCFFSLLPSGSGRGSLSGNGRGSLSGSGRGSLSGNGRGSLSGSGRGVLIGRGWSHRVARISNSSSLLTCNHPTKPRTEPQLLSNRDHLTEPRPSD